MTQLKVTWIRSCIHRPAYQGKVIQALGLRRLHMSVVHADTPTMRGMIRRVSHLLDVKEVDEPRENKPAPRRRSSAATTDAPTSKTRMNAGRRKTTKTTGE